MHPPLPKTLVELVINGQTPGGSKTSCSAEWKQFVWHRKKANYTTYWQADLPSRAGIAPSSLPTRVISNCHIVQTLSKAFGKVITPGDH